MPKSGKAAYRSRADGYFIDRSGAWWYRGNRINDPGLYRFFCENLTRRLNGSLLVVCEGEPCNVDAEDTPYVVRDFEVERGAAGRFREIALKLNGGLIERLDPKTLYLRPDGALACRVRAAAFDARFERATHYRLASLLKEDSRGDFILEWESGPIMLGKVGG